MKDPRDTRNRIAVAFYNLSYDGEEAISDLVEQYVTRISPISMDMKRFRYLLQSELLTYKVIVDKIIDREPLTEDELTHIQDKLTQIKVYQDLSGELRLKYINDVIDMFHRAYRFVVDLSWRRISLRRCIAEGCQRLFIPLRSNHQYCTVTCRDRQEKRRYRERKKLLPPTK